MFNRIFAVSFSQIKPYYYCQQNYFNQAASLLVSQSFKERRTLLHTKPPTSSQSQVEGKFAANKPKCSNEQHYIQMHNDPDIFGGTANQKPQEIDDDDVAEEQFLENPVSPTKKLSTKQYADMIKEHLRNNRVKEAIDIVEIRMIKEDRVKPENYIYNLLIGGCARVGYSKKAFSLYNKMKQRNLKITGGTYTSLFNACSNAPWSQDGLHKANQLREIMFEKGYQPNESNYNAMIKAYGRCGDIQTAFKLVDEMKTNHLDIRVDTFNHLLQACASDKDLGFRHALLVWHKMHNRRQIPDIYSFNLMLRCIRDCEIGDLPTMQQLLESLLKNATEITRNKENQLLLQNSNDETVSIVEKSSDAVTPVIDEAPNLLAKQPKLGSLISLKEIRKPEDRLLLLGGTHCFLREMSAANVVPTIKTFTALLDVIPATLSAEKNLMSTIRRLNIKCDIDFFNILIKKRSLRCDYDAAKSVLTMIQTAGLQPDIVTYGVLALGCVTKSDARELLQDMYTKDFRMNIQILGAMLKQGCYHQNFEYILEIMKIVKDERIKPNEQFLMHLHNFQLNCIRLIKNSVRFWHNNYINSKWILIKFILLQHKNRENHEFKIDFADFQIKLKKWQSFMGFSDVKLDEAVKIVREHPWEQFQYSQHHGLEPEKNEKQRHKKKKVRKIPLIEAENVDGIDDNSNVSENVKRIM